MGGPRRLRNDPDIRRLTAEAAARRATLFDWEAPWPQKQPYLESMGYLLRSRYRPGWVPSWTLPGNEDFVPASFEDYENLPPIEGQIDATRLSDGRLVRIKVVQTDSDEIKIARLLSSPHLLQDPRNHCIPVLDSFTDKDDVSKTFMIMPFFQSVDCPPFETVADIVDFVGQILEGLVFIHGQNIAHRDCDMANVVMDADALYPRGFHPTKPFHDRAGLNYYQPLSRADGPVRYYFIDFGLSTHFGPSEPRLVVGIEGRDRTVPELSTTARYDPFKVDIFMVGNTLRTALYNKYSNVDFLYPLIEQMTQRDPNMRPNAAEVEEEWHHIRMSLYSLQTAWRLREREEPLLTTVVFDGIDLMGKSARIGKRLFRWISDLQG